VVGRTEDFSEDLEIPDQYRTTLRGYDEPIYARGRMANSESLDGSEDMMSETFFMSNMVPQLPRHNGEIWKGLENRA
jgi:endonuclease G